MVPRRRLSYTLPTIYHLKTLLQVVAGMSKLHQISWSETTKPEDTFHRILKSPLPSMDGARQYKIKVHAYPAKCFESSLETVQRSSTAAVR
jgi:hypothetical protein